MTHIPQGPYRCLCWRDGKLQPTGIMSYMEAIREVNSGRAEVAVLDRESWPQLYPNTGDGNVTRA